MPLARSYSWLILHVAGIRRVMPSRFFEWFQLAALACWGLLGVTRILRLRARGVAVIAADWERTRWQMMVDTFALACLLVWAYEVVAYAWPLRFHVGPMWLHHVLMESIVIKTLGAGFVSGAIVLYGVALRRLGASWRLGIDRSTPGPLVTDGIYQWTRHPIYVAFDLLFLGTFLVQGRLIFLLLALMWLPLLHTFMQREERFLAEFYGDSYREYCGRVGRYFSWHRYDQEPNDG
jgi:protein-S-isoprenylcysteine O-methyltransferase Ste14